MVSRMGAVVPDRDAVCYLQASVANRFVDKQSRRIVNAGLEPSTRRQFRGERGEVNARAKQIWKSINQRLGKEVAVDALEQVDTLGTDIADLKHVGAVNLPLNTERELFGVRRTEIRRNLSLRQIDWVQFAQRQNSRSRRDRLIVDGRWIGRQRQR